MDAQERKRVGFLMRILNVFAFSCMALFMALVVVENTELNKLLPPSPERTVAVLLAYTVAIITFNYTLALRGKNLLDWRTELYVILGLVSSLAAIFLTFALRTYVETKIWRIPFASNPEPDSRPTLTFLLLLIPAIALFYLAWRRAKSHPIWQSHTNNAKQNY